MSILTSFLIRNFVSRLPRGRGRLAKAFAGMGKQAVFELPGGFRGVKMHLDISKPIDRLVAFGAYQPELFATLDQLVKKDDFVLMAGANIGYVPLALARMGCQVVGFEADPRNVETCRRNLALNPQLEIQLVGQGLSDQKGKLMFWLSDTSGDSSFALHHHANKQMEVSVVTGDEALHALGIDRLDGIILDVEGWECHALEGLRQTISRQLPRWAIIECAPWALEGAGKSSDDLHSLIRSFGWRIVNPGGVDLLCVRDSA